MPERTLIIGSRGSDLALEQARRVMARLPGPSELKIIRTSGDRFTERPLGESEGVGFFTKEIEQALQSKDIDLAVHSLKDLPTGLAPGLCLGAVLERDLVPDILLVRQEALDPARELPLKEKANVGASSRRRQAIMQTLRPDLVAQPIRGNVPTRIEKVKRGDYDAILLSRAGVSRLKLNPAPLLAFELNPRRWVCAPGQATIAVELRAEDFEGRARLSGLDHETTAICVKAERDLLVAYGGGCHAPFGSWAQREGELYQVYVAAPGADVRFRIRRFVGARLGDVQATADQWIRAGCPAFEPDPGADEDWIARPARPWH